MKCNQMATQSKFASISTRERYCIRSAQEALRAAELIDRARERKDRATALAAILNRLEQARIENAERYLVERLRRETSHDLS